MNRQRDRQRDRETDRQTDRQTERQDLFIVSVDGPEISNGEFRVDVFFAVERNEQTDRQRDRETDRQTDRQRDRETRPFHHICRRSRDL